MKPQVKPKKPLTQKAPVDYNPAFESSGEKEKKEKSVGKDQKPAKTASISKVEPYMQSSAP